MLCAGAAKRSRCKATLVQGSTICCSLSSSTYTRLAIHSKLTVPCIKSLLLQKAWFVLGWAQNVWIQKSLCWVNALSCSCLHDRVTEYSRQNAEGVACSSCLIHLFHSWSSTRRTWGTTGCESAEDETPRGSSHLKGKITTAKMNGIAAWQRHADVALEVPTAWQFAPHVHTQL